jgi:DNA-directed RNA polymerase specialized sigma24 family protein
MDGTISPPRRLHRERLDFVPKWEGTIERQAYAMALASEWKTRPFHDADDLLQEARFIFLRCVDAYPDVTEEKHFATLVRNGFRNKIIKLAQARTRHAKKLVVDSALLDHRQSRGNDLSSSASVAELLQQAQQDPALRRLVEQLVDSEMAPRPEREGAGPVVSRRPRQTTNSFLCSVAEQGSEVDMVRLVRHWLAGELRTCFA